MKSRLPVGLVSIEQDIAQERANTLARHGRQLETALAALRAHDRAPPDQGPRRRQLLDAAAQALWEFTVQREACGFRDASTLMRDYGVPAEVRLRMGASPIGPSRR